MSESANAPARLAVRVTAGATRTAIGEWHDGRLRIRVCAVAERGRANAAVTALVAKTLGLPKTAVRVAAGQTSPQKMLEIDGMTKTEVVHRLR